MQGREHAGRLALAGVFVAAGVFWIAVAARLAMWDGFAPSSGLMPLVYGILLVALALAAAVADLRAARAEDGVEKGPIGRPALILLTMAVAAAGIEVVGFFVAILLAMPFLYRIVERLPLVASLAASAASALVLTVVFRGWLGVPLPAGPWGY